jgi:hypothetical protein
MRTLRFPPPFHPTPFRLLLISLALAGCIPTALVEPSSLQSTQTTSPTSIPTPSPTPSVALSFEKFDWIKPSGIHPWRLIGTITNQESFPVEHVTVHFSVPDSEYPGGFVLTAPTVPSVIQPSQSGFFQIELPVDSTPDDFTLSYTAQRSMDASPVNTRVDVLTWRESTDGRLVALGEVENQGDHLLHLMAIHLVLYDDKGHALGVASSDHLVPALSPRNANPFQASSDLSIEIDTWKAFIEASPALLPSSPPLIFQDKLQIERTSQGLPFFIGQVENQGVTPWGLVLQVVYSMEDRVIGLDSIESPFPLPPRGQIDFVIDPTRSLTPDCLKEAQIEQVEIQLEPDPWKTLPIVQELITLPVTITQFEPIGNRLYLQGEITNPGTKTLAQTTVYVRILDLRGRTRASGWSQPIELLGANETQTFNLDLLIPGEIDLSLVEFDVRSFGYSFNEQ